MLGGTGQVAGARALVRDARVRGEQVAFTLMIDRDGRVVGGFHGTSVVQTHMTNSRLTDPEVLEFRFLVRLESYAIRTGSGGAGRWTGGDGGVRRVRFLEAMTASILSNGRTVPAFGGAAGQPGALGINQGAINATLSP